MGDASAKSCTNAIRFLPLLAHTHNDTAMRKNIARGMWTRKSLFTKNIYRSVSIHGGWMAGRF